MQSINVAVKNRKAQGRALTTSRVILGFAFFVLFLAILITGCSSQNNEITAGTGEKFSLKIGQSASISGENLAIRFVKVETDSRCPQGATCIWQGEVKCQVEIKYNGSLQNLTLTQPGLAGEPSRTEFEKYVIDFDVTPYPATDLEIKDGDYRLDLTITKK